jgi:hypothetical protein
MATQAILAGLCSQMFDCLPLSLLVGNGDCWILTKLVGLVRWRMGW